MENTESKITLKLYGNKHKASLSVSDPSLDDLVCAFVLLLQSHEFDIEDIHTAFVVSIISNMPDEPDEIDVDDKVFFEVATRKK
jgi:hypothetical protein